MRGLRKDCTQLLAHLPKKYLSNIEKEFNTEYMKIGFCEGLLQPIVVGFDREDKTLPCMLECIKDPFGPFNASEAMSAVTKIMGSGLAFDRVLNVCACIVKSHSDLSAFFKTSINMGNEQMGDQFVPMTRIVSEIFMFKMAVLGLDVTMDDWIKCGFEPPARIG